MLNKFLIISIFALGFGLSSAAAQTQTPTVIDGGVVNGKATSLPVPKYPAAALAVKASGTVKVQVTIDENGSVVSASAISGHPLLRAASEQAARRATFSPTLLAGQSVKVTGIITYNFIAPAEKLMWTAVSATLTIVAKDNWQPEIGGYLTKLAPITFADFPEEKEMLLVLLKTQGNNRAEVINKVLASLENKLPEQKAWQVKIGKFLGEVMFECRNQIYNADYQLEENKLRENLRAIGNLANSAPSDVSPETLETLKVIAGYAEKPTLKDSENLVGVMRSLTEFIKTVSPETVK